MRINVLTLFPDMIQAGMSESMMKRAQALGVLDLKLYHYRDFAYNKHKKVDDTPYGGGAGLVMSVDPVKEALAFIKGQTQGDGRKHRTIYLSPKGKPLTQAHVHELSNLDSMTLLCGHYEGFDQRIIDLYVDEEISIGDYVLTGGELAAMVVMDATVRLLPGVLGKEASHQEDSFSNGLLEYPHYTKPSLVEGLAVPEVLLSGNHGEIDLWRYGQSLKITYERRPELFWHHIELVLSSPEKPVIRKMIKAYLRSGLAPEILSPKLTREMKKLLYR